MTTETDKLDAVQDQIDLLVDFFEWLMESKGVSLLSPLADLDDEITLTPFELEEYILEFFSIDSSKLYTELDP